MRDIDIHVGDVLRVRTWNDMEDEFGSDRGVIRSSGEEGSLLLSNESFTTAMRHLCGKTFTVESIHTYSTMLNDYTAEEPGFGSWCFEAWMLEPIPAGEGGSTEEEFELENPDALFGFLLS